MASDILNAVLAAEKAAVQAEADAKEKAEQIKIDAAKRADEILARATAYVQAIHKENAGEIRKQAAALEEKAANEAIAQGERIKQAAASRRDEAVEAVSRHILA